MRLQVHPVTAMKDPELLQKLPLPPASLTVLSMNMR